MKEEKPPVPYWLLKLMVWLLFVGTPLVTVFPSAIWKIWKGSHNQNGEGIIQLIFATPVLLGTVAILYLFLHYLPRPRE